MYTQFYTKLLKVFQFFSSHWAKEKQNFPKEKKNFVIANTIPEHLQCHIVKDSDTFYHSIDIKKLKKHLFKTLIHFS